MEQLFSNTLTRPSKTMFGDVIALDIILCMPHNDHSRTYFACLSQIYTSRTLPLIILITHTHTHTHTVYFMFAALTVLSAYTFRSRILSVSSLMRR